MSNNATAPPGYEWGERTKQGWRALKGYAPEKDWKTDAEEMRSYFCISRFDPTDFDQRDGRIASWIYPDMLIHEWDSKLTTRERGVSTLVRGKRGSGKTTLRDYLAIRLIEDDSKNLDIDCPNDERVVIRGRPDSSDWRRINHWTTLWLPSGCNARVDVRARSDDTLSVDDLARDVVYYDGVMDLLRQIEERPSGTINVVYPDPEFRECQEVIEQASGVPYEIEVFPESEPHEDYGATPTSSWWFCFLLARSSFGKLWDDDDNPMWMTVQLDEIVELAPENPPGGPKGHYTWEFVQMLTEMMIDTRKVGLSIIGYCHFTSDVASVWRKQFNVRISMPDDRPNPIAGRSSTFPAGWDSVKMEQDLISHHNPGVGLCYSESKFSKFSWDEMARQDSDPELPPFRLEIGKSADNRTFQTGGTSADD